MALTKTVDGKPLPPEQFAYVGDAQDPSTWHLPIDHAHLQSALDLFGHETHVPDAKKAGVARKIAAKAKDAGLDTSGFEKKYCGGSGEHAEQPDYSNGWIEIFRAGDYAKQGKRKITTAELQRIVDNYDPSYHEAPIVVGHPQQDGPAYGWIDRIALKGDTLLAKEKQVDPAFAELRKEGRFKKRSAAFYQDTDGNPIGLRHVGWLGAQPPAVKGLRDVAFDDHGREFTEFEEEVMAAENEKTLAAQITEQISAFFAERLGLGKKQESNAATFSEGDVKRIVEEAVKPLQDKATKLEAELTTQKAQFAERETRIATGETQQRAIAAANKLKADGRWIPAFEKMGLEVLFAELAKNSSQLEYGEGDAKKKQTPLEILTSFMEALPKIVPSGRVFTGAPASKAPSVQFTEGKGVRADQNSIALNEEAMKRAKEKNLTFAEALNQVASEHPELCVPGGAQAGAV